MSSSPIRAIVAMVDSSSASVSTTRSLARAKKRCVFRWNASITGSTRAPSCRIRSRAWSSGPGQRKPRRAHWQALVKTNEVSEATGLVVMGRVIGPYGVQGWIKARTFTASPDGLLAYRAWWLATGDSQWREFAVCEACVHADGLVARLEGPNRREEVAHWRCADVGVPRGSV